MFHSLLLALSLFALVACGSAKSAAPVPLDALSGNQLDTQAMRVAINAVRATGTSCEGVWYPPVPALSWDTRLEAAALRHSEDMDDGQFLSHTGSDGSSPAERVLDTGYTYSVVAENAALGHTSLETVMSAWLASPGHCANIMRSTVSEVGAARVGNAWTQVFAHPLQAAN